MHRNFDCIKITVQIWLKTVILIQCTLLKIKGCIFVMGDNRNHSSDSRDSRLGTVDTRCVLGKAVFLAFPGADDVTGKREFGRIGLIDGVDA